MSTKNIAEVLQELLSVHQAFRKLAKEKAEVLKKGDMPALDQLIKKEAVVIQQLKKLEQDRLFVVEQYLHSKGLVTEGVTMAQLIQMTSPEEQEVLEKLQQELLEEIEGLKAENELNQQLIQDSLRFVNLSLDMLSPQQDEDVNYKRPKSNQYEGGASRSIFDSRA
ncbi:flagellar protein FlgN [Alkalihalobacterium bogoriense]|uniref:flagellar protein FlgN n=1 Tax=Alkalihalobacterium bogoriense TaxID=246272 RepID=UPI00047C8C3B|nr:flagellar protein FlgN [Alkalihalobacterium bogoriense]